MRELTIHHVPAKGRRRAQVRVSYRPDEGAQLQERQAPFAFSVSDDQRRLIQWYLEEYLLCPWGVYPKRAEEAERLMERLGAELFEAVFGHRGADRERARPGQHPASAGEDRRGAQRQGGGGAPLPESRGYLRPGERSTKLGYRSEVARAGAWRLSGVSG